MNIYVVTDGIYSDYHIEAVFTSEELANKFVQQYGGDVEVFEADKFERQLREGLKTYSVSISIEGKVAGSCHGYNDNMTPGYKFAESPYHNKMLLQVWCFATDNEHAIKIANEYRTALLSLNRWGIVTDDIQQLTF